LRRLLTAAVLSLTAVGLQPGCLGPRVDDRPGFSRHILPPGTAIPPVSDNPLLVQQIAANDGLRAEDFAPDPDDPATANVIPRRPAFSAGLPVHYYDFGPAPDVAAPLYIFVNLDDPANLLVAGPDGPHPFLLDSIPGDVGYSPFWTLMVVPVTTTCDPADPAPCRPFFAQDGAIHKITSVEALADAQALGIVAEPFPLSEVPAFAADTDVQLWVNCPVVRPGLKLEVGDEVALAPVQQVARGHLVDVFIPSIRLGAVPPAFLDTGDALLDALLPVAYTLSTAPLFVPPGAPRGAQVPQGDVFLVRGPNDVQPLATNNVFQTPPNPAPTTVAELLGPYTPLVRPIDVVVTDPTGIDDEADLVVRDAAGALQSTTDLVQQLTILEQRFNWPLQFQ
jgi:hypothetical protein